MYTYKIKDLTFSYVIGGGFLIAANPEPGIIALLRLWNLEPRLGEFSPNC